jgi:hypothetical protein
MTIKDLQAKYPYNNWVSVNSLIFVLKLSKIQLFQLEYFNELLPNVSQVTEDEVINVSVPNFLSKLGELLEKTPKR